MCDCAVEYFCHLVTCFSDPGWEPESIEIILVLKRFLYSCLILISLLTEI